MRAKKVLVVDDESGIRFLLSEVLSNQGFEVSLAKDGKESLDRLAQETFDLVITDIHMPRMDGIAMLKAMHDAGREEKVVVMSGYPMEGGVLDAQHPPVVSHLLKPFAIDSFLNVVNQAMSH